MDYSILTKDKIQRAESMKDMKICCPFNKNHKLMRFKLHDHLMKCKDAKKRQNERLYICVNNAFVISIGEENYIRHCLSCRVCLERYNYEHPEYKLKLKNEAYNNVTIDYEGNKNSDYFKTIQKHLINSNNEPSFLESYVKRKFDESSIEESNLIEKSISFFNSTVIKEKKNKLNKVNTNKDTILDDTELMNDFIDNETFNIKKNNDDDENDLNNKFNDLSISRIHPVFETEEEYKSYMNKFDNMNNVNNAYNKNYYNLNKNNDNNLCEKSYNIYNKIGFVSNNNDDIINDDHDDNDISCISLDKNNNKDNKNNKEEPSAYIDLTIDEKDENIDKSQKSYCNNETFLY